MAVSVYDRQLNFNTMFFWQVMLATLSLVLIASLFTNDGLYSPWFNHLDQAPWVPPTWLFVFGWTMAYLLVAFTGFIGLQLDPYQFVFFSLYLAGLFLNVLWSLAFFTLESVTWGLGLLIILDVIVLAQIIYLIWVGARVKSNALIVAGSLLFLYLGWIIYLTTLHGYLLWSDEG